MILNKEVRANRSFIGVCEAALETSGDCVFGAQSAPAQLVLLGMVMKVFRYG